VQKELPLREVPSALDNARALRPPKKTETLPTRNMTAWRDEAFRQIGWTICLNSVAGGLAAPELKMMLGHL
jgi:hypothetical protein